MLTRTSNLINPFRSVRKLFQRKSKKNPKEPFRIARVDSMHADVRIPMTAKDGEEIRFVHDGKKEKVRIPAGKQGQIIRIKMISMAQEDESREPSTGFLCCV